ELALVEGKAADHREHAAGPGVHHHHRTGDFRYLLEAILPLDRLAFLEQRIDIDDVAGLQHLRHERRRLAFRGSRDGSRPFHAVERNEARFALLADGAAEVASRLEADP